MTVKAEKSVQIVEQPVEMEVVTLTLTVRDASLIRYRLYGACADSELSRAEKDACQRVYDALCTVADPHIA